MRKQQYVLPSSEDVKTVGFTVFLMEMSPQRLENWKNVCVMDRYRLSVIQTSILEAVSFAIFYATVYFAGYPVEFGVIMLRGCQF